MMECSRILRHLNGWEDEKDRKIIVGFNENSIYSQFCSSTMIKRLSSLWLDVYVIGVEGD